MGRTLLIGLVTVVFALWCGRDNKSGSHCYKMLEGIIPKGRANSNLFYVYEAGYEGYQCFRIPAIIKTKSGKLLAFAEARKNNCSDEGNIDLVVRRSNDAGASWGKLQVVWSDEKNTCGNPVPVMDQKTGRIHLLMTWNNGKDNISLINAGRSIDTRRVFYTYSDDEGISWTVPREITAEVKEPDWSWYATGPCHGIQIHNGAYAGRLIIPCDYIEKGPGRKGYSHIIYSDDDGETWNLGGISPESGVNECTVAEICGGQVMLNMRSHSGIRMVCRSNNGGTTWNNMKGDSSLIDPICQGSLISVESEVGRRLYFSNPASNSRKNMTVKMSIDDGLHWSILSNVYEGPSAYSDLVFVGEDKIGILFEAGLTKPYEGIAYKCISTVKSD